MITLKADIDSNSHGYWWRVIIPVYPGEASLVVRQEGFSKSEAECRAHCQAYARKTYDAVLSKFIFTAAEVA